MFMRASNDDIMLALAPTVRSRPVGLVLLFSAKRHGTPHVGLILLRACD